MSGALPKKTQMQRSGTFSTGRSANSQRARSLISLVKFSSVTDSRKLSIDTFPLIEDNKFDKSAIEKRACKAFYEERAPYAAWKADKWYNHLIRKQFGFLVPPGVSVLEIGCGIGDLLAAVKPSRGVGVDFAASMLSIARDRHPELEFHQAEGLNFSSEEKFDYVILSDLLNDLPDVQALLTKLKEFSHSRTRVVINVFNNLWRPVLWLAEKLGAKDSPLQQNWLSKEDVANLLHLAGWEVIKTDARILYPVRTPVVASLMNRFLAPFLGPFCLGMFFVARPRPVAAPDKQYHCTVVIPARNEAGNIEPAVLRTPELGFGTEIILVEGHSSDNTWEEILRVRAKYPERNINAIRQSTSGKGGAVREAFDIATGDLLFILDADLTMPPEELPKFYEVARNGNGDFVNGVRLVYPMEGEAMRFLNMVGNHFFSLVFSALLGQRIKDTLCGTKVLFRKDYQEIARNRSYFGDFDPFGDFDLLFGAAKLNLRIIDLPIRYRARTYGQTNIQRWKHGLLLLRMTLFAARRLKFIG
jgi:SAM-dependent methyltransferase